MTKKTPKDESDFSKMLLLILLYGIQAIPMGLAFGAIPFLLQSKASYTLLGVFSLVGYPYSMKLLWSPFVDCVYSKTIGRRKTWIVAMQCLCGIAFFWLSSHAESLIESATKKDLELLTLMFFICILTVATQDIAVDGWAITLLSKKNLGYATTCQSIGLVAGYTISFTGFLSLSSIDFCNTYIRSIPQPYPILTLSSYLKFWGFGYFLVSILVLVTGFKDEPGPQGVGNSVTAVYKRIWEIMKGHNMKRFIGFLLMCKIGWVAYDSVSQLKMVEKGVHRESIAILNTLTLPFEFYFAVHAGTLIKKATPLAPWLKGFAIRIALCSLSTLFIYWLPSSIKTEGTSWTILFVILLIFIVQSFANNLMMVSMGSFFAHISDADIGGTNMTLLNTVFNLGGTWPKFFVFYLVDFFTTKSCWLAGEFVDTCGSAEQTESCTSLGGECIKTQDGFFSVVWISIFTGAVLGAMFFRKLLRHFGSLKETDWR